MKIGEVISNYKLLAEAEKRGKNKYYLCECINCGTKKEVAKSNLQLKNRKRGWCSSCKTDSHYLYLTWKSMINRCYNKNNYNYNCYGGRGITVCDRWRESFWNFYEDMEDRPEGTTLDRIDNDLGYYPENCRWGSVEQQLSNQRKNVWIDYQGKKYTEAQLARLTGVSRTAIQARRKRGIISGEDLVDGLRRV